MAPTLINVLPITRTGLTPIPAALPVCDAVNGNWCPNDGSTYFEILNGDASIRTLTVVVANGVDGLTAGPRVYSLPISALHQQTGVFPVRFYGSSLLFTASSAGVRVQPWSVLGS